MILNFARIQLIPIPMHEGKLHSLPLLVRDPIAHLL